ncbi:hypothetical protein [Demequina rhizosphaerae]|uniref:hypothetical protein n=1 Tax=Demequina rhizosphaerae TaxID=1638985 RepID=UPI0007851FAF|nr:hypothetical protein [Demequina rhizosphaerae]
MAAIAMTLAAVAFAAPASAQGKPDGVGGGGGKPPGVGDTEYGNNLSTPTIFVTGDGDSPMPTLRVECALSPQAPGDDGEAAVGGYWLQKTKAEWSASCTETSEADVVIDWGDNLTGTTALKANKVIRVEAGLFAPADATTTGYLVSKLTDEIDRLATYGTDGTVLTDTLTRVWDNDAHLTIDRKESDGSLTTLVDEAAVAEINSLGSVVYGFNWGQKGNFPQPGNYRITFTVSAATDITGVVDTVGDTDLPDLHTATLDLTLTPSGSKRAR